MFNFTIFSKQYSSNKRFLIGIYSVNGKRLAIKLCMLVL